MLRSGLHSLPLGLNAHMATSQHTYLDPSVKRALEALDAKFARKAQQQQRPEAVEISRKDAA